MKPYRRGDSPYWWIGWAEPKKSGGSQWLYKSSETTVYREAEKVLAEIEELISKGKKVAASPETVAGYAEPWSKERGARRDDEKVWGAEHELGLLEFHVFGEIGKLRLVDVRPRDIRALVKTLKTKKKPDGEYYAARTIRNIYGVVHSLFEDAVAEELIEVSPCVLKSGDMPAIVDADPEWRDEAEYTRAEVLQLVTDARIPFNRRVWWALGFFTGMRTGEAAALRWRHYDTAEKPLGLLKVTHSYNAVHKRVKSTKTKRPRRVPVHPALAVILGEWKRSGWAELNGRAPGADDLLITNERGGHLSDINTKKTRPRDLVKLGLRVRRFHDARATFITMGTTDGADEVWLERVTHNAKGNQFNQYRRANWLKMCEAVSCLSFDPDLLRDVLRSGAATMEDRDIATGTASAVGGSRTHDQNEQSTSERVDPRPSPLRDLTSSSEKEAERRNVGRTADMARRARALLPKYSKAGGR